MSSLVVHSISAAMEEIIGISSSFHVKERCFEKISIFEVFTGIDNFFFFGGGLAYTSTRFGIFLIFPNFFKILNLQLFRNSSGNSYIPCLLLITTIHYLWGQKNLVKYQKISKYYDHHYLQNFLFLFMSLLTAPIVKNSPILAGI